MKRNMIALTIIAALLPVITLLEGCGSSIACTATLSAEAKPWQRAKIRGTQAIDLLAEGELEKANACAKEAVRDTDAMPSAVTEVYKKKQEDFVSQIRLVEWSTENWKRGGAYRTPVPKNWEKDLEKQFRFVLSLAQGMSKNNPDDALGAIIFGLSLLAHFDPADKLRTYATLLGVGAHLIAPWAPEPEGCKSESNLNCQKWILFYATVGAWPYVRDSNMVEVERACSRLKKVTDWDDSLKKTAERAKIECEEWLLGNGGSLSREGTGSRLSRGRPAR